MGVDSFDSLSKPHPRSKNDLVDDELMLRTVAFAAVGDEIPSTLSNSGLSWRMIDFQLAERSAEEREGKAPGDGG